MNLIWQINPIFLLLSSYLAPDSGTLVIDTDYRAPKLQIQISTKLNQL